MSFRARVTALAAVFVALLAALVVGTVIAPRGGSSRAAAAALLPGLKPERAQAVEVRGPSGRIVLSKTQGWTVEVDGARHPAAPDRVEGLLKLLAAMPRGTVVTRDAKAAEGLGLSAAEATHIVVTATGGATLVDLSVGKMGPAGGSYLRVGQAAEVFQTGEGLSPYLSASRASWLDLRVLPRDVQADLVMRVSAKGSVTLPEATAATRLDYTMLKEKDSSGAMSWSFSPAAGRVDQQAAAGLVNALAGIEGSDIVAKGDPLAAILAAPQATVTISLTDNRTLSLVIGARTPAGQYPCALEGSATMFLVPEWRVQAILLPREKLAPGDR
jgi:hypothetical protein